MASFLLKTSKPSLRGRSCMNGYSSASLEGKSFGKAVSVVMDDLEKCHLIIDNHHFYPLINLRSN
jgi:hypothetical protein